MKQVFDFIERQAAVCEFDRISLGHSINALWLAGENWKRIEVARLASVSQPQPADLALLQTLALASRASDRKYQDLLVLDAFGFTQAVHFNVLELERQDVPANSELRNRNNQYQNATRLQPTVRMLEEERFEPLAGAFVTGGSVVGRLY